MFRVYAGEEVKKAVPGIPQNILDDILDRSDIVEIISSHIPLRKAGRNFKALCPFHHEKTSSFMISPDKQIYHCFGCFPTGSLIKTAKGFHKIEDVQKGQTVLTHRGRFMPVIRTLWRPYEGKVAKIYTRKSNLPVSLTSDHEVYVVKTKNCKYRSRRSKICQWRCKLRCPAKFFTEYKIEKLQAQRLSINDFLLYPVDQEINDVDFLDLDKYYFRRESNFGPTISRIPTKIKVDEKFLRLIGYWIAEGSNHRAYIRFSLGNNEIKFAKEIQRLIKEIFKIKASVHIRNKRNRTGLEITACNSKLSDIFGNLCGKGAENKHIPFELQNLSPGRQRIILDAIFKGDRHIGKVSKSTKNRRFKATTTVSLVLAEQLKDILLRLGISPTFRVQKAKVDKNNVRHKTAYIIAWQDDIKLHFSDVREINKLSYQILPIRKIRKEKFKGNVYNLTVATDHSYTTPNFVVGNCGAGGNAFNFLMKYERMEFLEVVKFLAKKTGVTLPVAKRLSDEEVSLIDRLKKANELAASFFANNLLSGEYGKGCGAYLEERHVSKSSIIKFRLGYGLNSWNALIGYAGRKGINTDMLSKAGLVIKSSKDGSFYDRFRNRLIFPVFDMKGQIIAFGGRVLDDNLPKYVNSPETPLYTKGRHLYGLNFAKNAITRSNFAIIVEGYTDLISCHQAGVENIVASCGTAFTPEQSRLLKRFTNEVVMVFDADQAGEAATLRNLDMLVSEGFNVRLASLPTGYDPDSFMHSFGREKFNAVIEQAKDLFSYKLGLLLKRHKKSTPEGKSRIVSEMLPTLWRIPNEVLKSSYMKKLAQQLDVDEKALHAELKKIKGDYTYYYDHDKVKPDANRLMKSAEKILVSLMLENAGYISEVKKELDCQIFQDDLIRRIVKLLYELHGESKEITPSKLISHLGDESASTLISELASDGHKYADKEKNLCDCIKWIKQNSLKLRLRDLQTQIQLAESSNDQVRLRELLTQYNTLVKNCRN